MRSGFALVAVLSACTLAGCWEVSEISYKNFEEAKKAGAIGESKWLPEWLPEDARDIRESHDVDTNQSWLSFRLETPLRLPSSCSPVRSLESVDASRVLKFPGFVRDMQQRIKELEGEFYECSEGNAVRWVAVDLDAHLVYSGINF